ncbi:ciliary microtubule associated protein 1B [Aulostomus maculatus]
MSRSEESWVGTWRPHKPRGPIAAIYGSPGPKYAPPALIGSIIHDSTKNQAPRFSFGKRHNKVRSDFSPGPKYLVPSNITRTGRNGTPAFSLHYRTKEPRPFQTPGPGHYRPEHSGRSVTRSAPAYSLFGRTKQCNKKHSPGPAAYTLPEMLGRNTVAIPSAPAHSLGGRLKTGSFYEDLKKTPGPAAYNAVEPNIYCPKPPQFSITGRNFQPDDTTKKPGPATYKPDLVTTKRKAPSFTFGVRHSQYLAPLLVDVDE